ncbi:MAG: cysteine--tRNA ligase [Thermosynechococcaceae cyanobacterium MS004]|nr:cysteine--tRNA ligase [Thermosynechococcaceae cyanobacterium MS004]
MSLTLYNSLSRRKEPFETLTPGRVLMYCCGVTVYDYCHLGHARSYIVWDTVRRYLEWRGYAVQYVQNFTDIDDKILKRAREEQSTMAAVSEKYIAAYFEDMERLNIRKANAYPRATHALNGIQRLIHELEQKGIAYAAEGDVYYSVRSFPGYGKLSGRKLDDMQAGASGRVEVPESNHPESNHPESSHPESNHPEPNTSVPEPPDDPSAEPKKKDPFDFALWKAAKPEEPFWDSPWGAGRPGWHIECSAMVRDGLGEQIDIHVGGADLIFPHHENEIAQSEAVTGKSLARYWLHNGMVNVEGEKMSKSLGNFTTIRQLLDEPLAILEGDRFDPMALRLFVLQAQYRKPIDFTPEAISSAQISWQTLKAGLTFAQDFGNALGWTDLESDDSRAGLQNPSEVAQQAVQRFQSSMDDDFNSPGALAVLFELAKELRRAGNVINHVGKSDRDASDLRQEWQTLVDLSTVLGLEVLGLEAASAQEASGQAQVNSPEIEAMIAARTAARQSKNFAESDRLRDLLKAQGITLIDQPDGTTRWRQGSARP